MSNIDKQALREIAEKATSGKWERGDGNGNGGELLVYCDDALGSAVCEMTSEYNAIPKYQRINNLNFIAAANPATVLALLDELEAKDKQIANLKEAFRIALSATGIDAPAAVGKGEVS
nr:ead/Ea22-like family protein [Enterobacter hormaechei]